MTFPVSRRDFVAGSTTLALGAMIVPRAVLGGPGYRAPSAKLNIAMVGIGGMGMSNMSQLLSENIVAICDVDFPYVERSLQGRLKPRQGIVGSSSPWGGGEKTPATYPMATTVQYEYPAVGKRGPVKLFWYDGGLMPPRPAMLPDDAPMANPGSDGGGGVFIGEKGIMFYETYGNKPRIYPEALAQKAAKLPVKLPRISVSHEMNWVAAAKGEATASSPFSLAAPLTETMLLGIVALRAGQGRKVVYDGAAMNITNIPDANQYLTRQYRKGWEL